MLLCEVRLALACQNLLEDQELLRCRSVPIWSYLHTALTRESNLFTDTYAIDFSAAETKAAFSPVVHTIYMYNFEQAGRCAVYLPVGRMPRQHAWVGCG